MNRIDTHQRICEQLHGLYAAKNSDYSNSFATVREEFPKAILIRLADKLNRLKALIRGNAVARVSDESIDDTLADLANYAIMELVERRMDEEHWAMINRESVPEASASAILQN